MKMMTIVCLSMLLVACASDPAKRAEVAKMESGRMPATSVPLSNYGEFILADMELAPDVLLKPEKVEVAKTLELKLQEVVSPVLSGWASKSAAGEGKKLVITPKLIGLHIVSGGARFWAGAFSGESYIDMDLLIVDSETGETIAEPRVRRSASAMTGAWSIGKSDRNLLDYIADITKQYLIDNYQH